MSPLTFPSLKVEWKSLLTDHRAITSQGTQGTHIECIQKTMLLPCLVFARCPGKLLTFIFIARLPFLSFSSFIVKTIDAKQQRLWGRSAHPQRRSLPLRCESERNLQLKWSNRWQCWGWANFLFHVSIEDSTVSRMYSLEPHPRLHFA